MAIQATNLLADNSTFANFFAWSTFISGGLQTGGWIQSNDTGQVMWSGMTLSACGSSGGISTYTFASLTGLALSVGRALNITGMTNAANNGTFVILSVTGSTSGSFTVANLTGVTEAGSTGVVTAQSTVPGSGASFYEIWQPNDGLTVFYFKIEYGNFTGQTNSPVLRASLAQLTSGTGVLIGAVLGQLIAASTNTAASATSLFDSRCSGGTSRFGAMMWRGWPGSQLVYVERSVNSSGVYTGSHVTLVLVGTASTAANVSATQQTIMLNGAGVAPTESLLGNNSTRGGLAVRVASPAATGTPTAVFQGNIPFDTVAPMIGYYDYQLLGIGATSALVIGDAQTISVLVYGSSHTYYCSSSNTFGQISGSAPNTTLCMRYE